MPLNHSRVISSLVLVSSAVFLPPAHAQDSPFFYAGAADLWKARTRISDQSLVTAGLTPSRTTRDSSDTGWKVFAGRQFTPYLAVEGSYAALGDLNSESPEPGIIRHVSVRPTVWSLDALGSYPLPYGFSVFARLGIARSNTKASVEDRFAIIVPGRTFRDSSWGYHAGLGAAYDFNKWLGVRAEWERYRVADGIGGRADVDLVSVGLRVKF
jgi:OmpA-OmpF porin, OOP family